MTLREPSAVLAALAFALTGCSKGGGSSAGGAANASVALALYAAGGAGAPLELLADHRFHVGEIELVFTADLGPVPDVPTLLATLPAGLDWSGLDEETYEWTAESDGSWTLRRFLRGAAWMGARNTFTVSLRDGAGRTMMSLPLDAGAEGEFGADNAFPIRRFAVILKGSGGITRGEIAGLHWTGELRVQLRNGDPAAGSFALPPGAAFLDVAWDQAPNFLVTHPVTVETPAADGPGYGLRMDFEPLSPPPGGVYAPGADASFRVVWTDGAGRRLFPEGTLPSYAEFLAGHSMGLRYYDFFPAVVYYRNKNHEGIPLVALGGPNQSIVQTMRVLDSASFQQETHVAATTAEDGFHLVWRMIPPAPVVFGGLFAPAAWAAPVSDVFTFSIPAGAGHGTWTLVGKSRRIWKGEAVTATGVLEISVGDPAPTKIEPEARYCESCHQETYDLSRLLHGNGRPETCVLCHVAMDFEINNLLAWRAHTVHFRSKRYVFEKKNCAYCHSDPDRILYEDRYGVCVSCHEDAEIHAGQAYYVPHTESCSNGGCHAQYHDFVVPTDTPWPRIERGR